MMEEADFIVASLMISFGSTMLTLMLPFLFYPFPNGTILSICSNTPSYLSSNPFAILGCLAVKYLLDF
jgi:hypothetical protein